MVTDTKTKKADTKRIPNPLYAVAGAGDLAYEQLRKLPAKALELRERAIALRPTVVGAVKEPAIRVDMERLRTAARHNAKVLRHQAEVLRRQAEVAQDKAVAMYAELVARGEKVVGGPYKALEPAGDVVEATAVPADAPSAETSSAAAASGNGTSKSPAKAVKKTRPTAVK